MTSEQLKQTVRDHYGEIAASTGRQESCCGPASCCSPVAEITFNDPYTGLEGYVPDADLALGCGIPTESAGIKTGDTVLDLGSGAGNDAFVARSLTGETGWVLGVDFTPAMIERAVVNAGKLGFSNVEFRLGDIENLPVEDGSADVVISNCVLNLVPDKVRAFSEIYRVLKPGGHLSVSDVVMEGNLPDSLKKAAELYAGCVSGALEKTDYLGVIRAAGLTSVQIRKEKPLHLPASFLADYSSPAEAETFRHSGGRLLSITVYAEKPAV